MRCALLIGALPLLLIGCIPPPKQTGGLAFFDHEGLEHRMRMLCRLGVGDDEVKTACAVPEMRRRLGRRCGRDGPCALFLLSRKSDAVGARPFRCVFRLTWAPVPATWAPSPAHLGKETGAKRPQ